MHKISTKLYNFQRGVQYLNTICNKDSQYWYVTIYQEKFESCLHHTKVNTQNPLTLVGEYQCSSPDRANAVWKRVRRSVLPWGVPQCTCPSNIQCTEEVNISAPRRKKYLIMKINIKYFCTRTRSHLKICEGVISERERM